MIAEREFIRLFLQHETELRGFATTLMLNHMDAEDVLQDACVAMWQRIGDLEHAGSFRGWAYTFVRFTALNRIRKRNRSPLIFSEKLMGVLADEGEGESERSQAELAALAECLDKLPAGQSDLVRRYYASASVRMAEVAAELQKGVAGLYKSLERIREALQLCIEKRLTDQGYEKGITR